jgi:hypothetical protein
MAGLRSLETALDKGRAEAEDANKRFAQVAKREHIKAPKYNLLQKVGRGTYGQVYKA